MLKNKQTAASVVASVEEELAETEKEIQSHEQRLAALRKERDAFLIVIDRLRRDAPDRHPELITLHVNRPRRRGAITQAVFDVVGESATAMSTREVTATLLRRGIRPKGDEKNFSVTVAKCLKRLTKHQRLVEHKAGRAVGYSIVRTKRNTEVDAEQTSRIHGSNGVAK